MSSHVKYKRPQLHHSVLTLYQQFQVYRAMGANSVAERAEPPAGGLCDLTTYGAQACPGIVTGEAAMI